MSSKMDGWMYPYLPLMGFSTCFFLIFFKYVSPALMFRLVPTYRYLSRKKQIGMDNRVTAALHGVLSTHVFIYLIMFDEEISQDMVKGSSTLSKLAYTFSSGYFIADMLQMFFYYKTLGSVVFYLHHISSLLLCVYLGVVRDLFHYLGAWRGLAEFSTLFVNIRWCLATLEYAKTSVPYVVNGMSLFVGFFLCRIVPMPFFWKILIDVSDTPSFNSVYWIGNASYCCCAFLDILNIYWFGLLFRGMLKVLAHAQKERNQTSKTI